MIFSASVNHYIYTLTFRHCFSMNLLQISIENVSKIKKKYHLSRVKKNLLAVTGNSSASKIEGTGMKNHYL